MASKASEGRYTPTILPMMSCAAIAWRYARLICTATPASVEVPEIL